jgi:hypothetical protein
VQKDRHGGAKNTGKVCRKYRQGGVKRRQRDSSRSRRQQGMVWVKTTVLNHDVGNVGHLQANSFKKMKAPPYMYYQKR